MSERKTESREQMVETGPSTAVVLAKLVFFSFLMFVGPLATFYMVWARKLDHVFTPVGIKIDESNKVSQGSIKAGEIS